MLTDGRTNNVTSRSMTSIDTDFSLERKLNKTHDIIVQIGQVIAAASSK